MVKTKYNPFLFTLYSHQVEHQFPLLLEKTEIFSVLTKLFHKKEFTEQ